MRVRLHNSNFRVWRIDARPPLSSSLLICSDMCQDAPKGYNLCTPSERVILLKVIPNCCRVRASPPTLYNSLFISAYWDPNMKSAATCLDISTKTTQHPIERDQLLKPARAPCRMIVWPNLSSTQRSIGQHCLMTHPPHRFTRQALPFPHATTLRLAHASQRLNRCQRYAHRPYLPHSSPLSTHLGSRMCQHS
jgi:hypothetical protein